MKTGFEVLDAKALSTMTLDEILSYQRTVCSHRRKEDWVEKSARVLYDIERAINNKTDEHEAINKDDFMPVDRFVELLHLGIGEDTSHIGLEEDGHLLALSSGYYDMGDCIFVKGYLDEEPIITLSLKEPVSNVSEVKMENIMAIKDIHYYYVDNEDTCRLTSVTVKGLEPRHLYRFIECLQMVEARIERRSAWDESSMAADELLCYEEYKQMTRDQMVDA